MVKTTLRDRFRVTEECNSSRRLPGLHLGWSHEGWRKGCPEVCFGQPNQQITGPDMHHSPRGTLFLWPDHWQVIGHLIPNRPHRHISASWLVGLDGPFRLQVDGHWRTTSAALVAPDVEQSLDPGGTRMWCAQLDPDSDFWRVLQHRLGDQLSVDIPVIGASLPSAVPGDCQAVWQALSSAVKQLGGQPEPMDRRVRKICDELRSQLPDKVDVALLAQAVGLSSSRLSHLFRQQTGVTLRRFLLHLKMKLTR